MAQINGTAVITVDGQELQSEGGSINFTPGFTVGKGRMGPRGWAGSSSVPNKSTMSCDIIPIVGIDLKSMAQNKTLTARVSDVDTGDEWIIPEMVMVEDPGFTDGESSKWAISFEGAEAEKV